MVIMHNLSAMNISGSIKRISLANSKNVEKLSSGYRINRSADDAAGLSISEKMRSQIRGLNRAARNAQDGISFIQVAEGALNESHAILQRCKELVVQGANDTNTDVDRAAIQAELDQLTEELDRVAKTTKFNTMDVFVHDGAYANKADSAHLINETAPAMKPDITVTLSFVDSAGNVVDVGESQAVGQDTIYKDSEFAKFVTKAAADAVSALYDKYSASMFKNSSAGINVGLNIANMDGAGSVLASASLSMSSGANADGAYTTMSYTLNIDADDYDATKFDTMTDEKKADLAATIAHEMTHLVMFDTVTDNMLGSAADFPLWFIEGMAQSSSGDNGWVAYRLTQSSTDDEIKNYMSQLESMPYGAGYLGTMYLGYAASGSNSTSDLQGDIVNGLNKIFDSLTDGKSLDDAIAENTTYAGLQDFATGFKGADSASLTFVKELITARGNGAGSLLATDLSVTEADAFATSELTDDMGNYTVKTDNTKYMNAFGAGYKFPEKQSGIAGANSELNLQVGALEGQGIKLEKYNVTASVLMGYKDLDVSDHDKATASITTVDDAIEKVSKIRSYYGAIQNRLEYTITNLNNTSENLQAAESLIRDTDMAEAMVEYSKNNILLQAAQAMMSQANQNGQGILNLIR